MTTPSHPAAPAAEAVRLTAEQAAQLLKAAEVLAKLVEFPMEQAAADGDVAALRSLATGATVCVVNRAEAERRLLNTDLSTYDIPIALDAIYGSEK